MEDPGTSKAVHSQVRELVDLTLLRCANAVQRISAYKLSLAEMGAMRAEISVAIKTAIYRSLMMQDVEKEAFFEPWSSDNEPTDPYLHRRIPRIEPQSARLWAAVVSRANRSYASKRSGASPTQLLRNRRAKRRGDREDL